MLAEGNGRVPTTLIGVVIRLLRASLLGSHLGRPEYELSPQVANYGAADDLPTECVEHDWQARR